MAKLKENFKKKAIPKMKKDFGYKNDLAVPVIEKVVVNTSSLRIGQDKKFKKLIMQDLSLITGQKPRIQPARRSEAGFKVRQGLPIGAKITLRGKRMWDFLDRLVNLALPRTRDFEGIDQKSFDQQGNLTIGIKEHTVFPEIKQENINEVFGLEICIVTTADQKKQAIALLKHIGFPIKNN